tara:strand:+ start:752 stop:1420 length:669 start_codon:yes stop_codon:yes gene_type:complete
MYIPKNRIKPNLYTPGDEYMVKSTNENYAGFYHSLWNGKIYTGKTQNETNKLELILFEVTDLRGTPTNPPALETTNVVALFLEDPDPIVEESQWNQRDIVTYLNLKGKSTIDDNPREMPYQQYPQPTEDDYALGTFTRYFLVKINQNQYFELNLDTYKKFTKQDAGWVWELFIPFKIQWTIVGILETVVNANRNQTLIAEQRLKRLGLSSFLNKSWNKFLKV